MKISVIIPTYNAGADLPRLYAALERQHTPFELLIVDSSSTDGTADFAKHIADTFLSIPKQTFDHGSTRTLAAKAAKGEIVVFLTQDAVPSADNTLDSLLLAFEETEVSAAYGRQLPYQHTSLFGKHLRYFNYPEKSHTRILSDKERYGLKTAFFSDSFGAYRKTVLEEIGWFTEGLILGEDMDAAARMLLAGYKIAYRSDAAVFHAHSYSLKEEFKRYFDTGVFHHRHDWLLSTFGKAEGEGRRYLKSEWNFLLQQHAYGHLPAFFVRNAMKYLGYTLGKQCDMMPKWLVQKLSMHPGWWEGKK